jgi:hypothetical protein
MWEMGVSDCLAEKDFGFEEADDALGQRIVHCPLMGH